MNICLSDMLQDSFDAGTGEVVTRPTADGGANHISPPGPSPHPSKPRMAPAQPCGSSSCPARSSASFQLLGNIVQVHVQARFARKS